MKLALRNVPRTWLIKGSEWLRPLLLLWYRGNNFQDPIDGSNFSKMLPYGYEKSRANALSPSTLSLERHRLLWLYLQNETNFFTDSLSVLHIAPEQCFVHRFKKLKHHNYVTADIESPLADVKADITNLPFDNQTFDVVLCNHVLEHVVEDSKAMEEIYRVMKNGAWAVLQIPLYANQAETYEDFSITDPEERRKHFGQYDHVRKYGMDYFRRLQEAGFRVEKVQYAQSLSEDEIRKYSVVADEIIPVVFKD
ncbi:MAG: methyltransferase domain-containing protein [Weeksellaceae bacterium]|nr:methyltransferase domain-containing protein [Weeksellaceae bacterium]